MRSGPWHEGATRSESGLDDRVVVVSGVGKGIGRAIAVAAAAARRFRGGVAFVDLTDVRDSSLVAAAVLEAAAT